MRIAMIGQKGVALGEKGGGIEMHVGNLGEALHRQGHDVTVYARAAYAPDEPEEVRGMSMRYTWTVYRKNLETIIHTFTATIDALRRPYDIIHYHGVGPSTLAWIPRLLKPRARVVATFHSQDRLHGKWGRFAKAYLHFGERAACWFPHATIAVSHVIQVYARRSYGRQVVYIPNGATVQDVEKTDRLERFGLAPGSYILNVSRLVPHKGQHYLIEGFKRMKRETGSDMKLVLVGAPAYTDEYLNLLRDLAAGDDDVVFAGYQSGETLRQLFAHAFLYCQPSESEGLAVVVLEAMSYGRPVLVSDIPENLEAMHHAGFSFRNKDPEDLAAKLTDLVRQPEKVGMAATQVQQVVEENFSWPMIAKKTAEVYRSVRH